MNPTAENLRELLDARDFMGFLEGYEEYRLGHTIEPAVTALTQNVFPSLLRDALAQERLHASTLVRLYKLVRSGRLLLVENDLLVGINQRINEAFSIDEPQTHRPVPSLITFDDSRPNKSARRNSENVHPAAQATTVKRVAIASHFSISTWSAVDAFDFRKNICASQQEREFLCAVRQFFPTLRPYPNVPLQNFIELEKIEATIPIRARSYGRLAQVDVLLCTTDEDPVAGIELDSVHHDSEEAVERDELKNLLFKCSGLPLIRIRADDEKAVRAEDFYDLLVAEAETLDLLRPRRLRPRRTHDFLVPAEVSHHSTANEGRHR